ncbi:MAG TPA: hypothetical protein VG167_09215 [Verrucomicrobiae bacterium]|nr:hypothetical protein [Verrucomicrobiae bacterium]
MPNQRAKNKVRLGGFIERRLYRQIVARAKAEGMADNKFGFVQQLLEHALARRKQTARRTNARRRASPKAR